MTIDVTMNKGAYNALKLDEDLREALSDNIAGVSTCGNRVTVHFLTAPSEADRALAQQVIAEHNANDLTAAQEAERAEAEKVTAADTLAANVPGWASWSEAEALSYIDDNLTDLASARTIIKAQTRMLLAMRDKLWPHLTA